MQMAQVSLMCGLNDDIVVGATCEPWGGKNIENCKFGVKLCVLYSGAWRGQNAEKIIKEKP